MILRLITVENRRSNPFHLNFHFFTYRLLLSYSDRCIGQNKNYLLVKFLADLQHEGIYEVINHKFLMRGHTFLENDRDFTQIEEQKTAQVLVPNNWLTVVREAKLTKPFILSLFWIIFSSYRNRNNKKMAKGLQWCAPRVSMSQEFIYSYSDPYC